MGCTSESCKPVALNTLRLPSPQGITSHSTPVIYDERFLLTYVYLYGIIVLTKSEKEVIMVGVCIACGGPVVEYIDEWGDSYIDDLCSHCDMAQEAESINRAWIQHENNVSAYAEMGIPWG